MTEKFTADTPLVTDELSFWKACKRLTPPRLVINGQSCSVPAKHCRQWLEKWERRGIYTYVSSIDLGWIIPEALDLFDPRAWITTRRDGRLTTRRDGEAGGLGRFQRAFSEQTKGKTQSEDESNEKRAM